jgi:hypothetical protein
MSSGVEFSFFFGLYCENDRGGCLMVREESAGVVDLLAWVEHHTSGGDVA